MHINFLNQIYPNSPPLQFLPYSCPHNFSLPASCVLLLTCENPLSSFGTGHGCRTIHWSMGTLSETSSLKKADSPHGQQLPKTTQREEEIHAPFPSPCWDFGSLDGSCATMCSYMQQPCHVLLYCRNPLSYRLPAPSSVLASEPLKGVMGYRCPIAQPGIIEMDFFFTFTNQWISKLVHRSTFQGCSSLSNHFLFNIKCIYYFAVLYVCL